MTIDTRNGQSEADVLLGTGFPVALGGRTFRVRPRTMRGDREWLELVQSRLRARFAAVSVLDSVGAVVAALADATEDMVDLILAYDQFAVLPPREWVEANAASREVTTAFGVVLEEAYPPFGIGRKLVPGDRATAVIGRLLEWALERELAALPEPTSSPSPPGDSGARPKSTPRSRRGSSRP